MLTSVLFLLLVPLQLASHLAEVDVAIRQEQEFLAAITTWRKRVLAGLSWRSTARHALRFQVQSSALVATLYRPASTTSLLDYNAAIDALACQCYFAHSGRSF
jgi:hypothetical protein